MMGGTYGRRVVVVAGKGNNGADGRHAAGVLARRGVRVQVVDAAGGPGPLDLGDVDLVIDAAYGTGFRGEYQAPDPGDVPVLAVDIPSGVDGLTGAAGPGAVRADRTVTFAALKPGLVFPPGRELAGRVDVVDIGLDVGRATMHVVEHDDVDGWVPWRPVDTHKWKSAVWVVAGSAGMTGAAHLCARAALRAGAGTVRLGIPGRAARPAVPRGRGPVDPGRGLGRRRPRRPRADESAGGGARPRAHRRRGRRRAPAGRGRAGADRRRRRRPLRPRVGRRRPPPSSAPVPAPTVLTPHDGEFKRLAGHPPGADRVAAARDLAARTHATVLLKGPTTVVADPSGEVLLCTAGDERLATAGTGDVLAGVVGAYLAQGLDGLRAAAAAAFVHGSAGHLGWRHGLVAGDLLDLLPAVLDRR